jgi:hypothetical protein
VAFLLFVVAPCLLFYYKCRNKGKEDISGQLVGFRRLLCCCGRCCGDRGGSKVAPTSFVKRKSVVISKGSTNDKRGGKAKGGRRKGKTSSRSRRDSFLDIEQRRFSLFRRPEQEFDIMTVEADCDILKDVFASTGGKSKWKDQRGWSQLSDIDGIDRIHQLEQVPGIKLNSKGNVEKIDLSGNGLEGSLPTVFHKLQCLREIDLSHNNLSGIIVFSID